MNVEVNSIEKDFGMNVESNMNKMFLYDIELYYIK